jgi:hypothetical protein
MPSVPFDRDSVLTDLKANVMKVQFIKENNQTRIMLCTLRPDMIKGAYDEQFLEEHHRKPENKNAVVVWDIDNQGWRSFKMNSVQWIETKDNLLYK